MKVLLISNKIFHYRIAVYNDFYMQFLKKEIQFEVLADEIQESDEHIEFSLHIAQRSYPVYKKLLKEIKPEVVIFFLHLKDSTIFPLYFFCRMNNIKIIYWAHGINIMTPDHKLKNLIFNYVHKKSDAIILYSPNELKFVKSKYHFKTQIASNTINLDSFPVIEKSKADLRKQYGLKFKTIVLYCGRISPGKRVDILIDILQRSDNKSIGLVIVGGGLSEEMQTLVDNQANIVYMGPVYDKIPVNELHKLSDIFCIPFKIGLSLNMAMYWSLPVLTTGELHGPEIYYLKNGVNGFIAKDIEELEEKIKLLAGNPELLKEFSKNAKRIITEEAGISNMFKGFEEAVDFVTSAPEQ